MSSNILNNVALTLDHFNNGKTVVVFGVKQTELYNNSCNTENMLFNALRNAIAVRLI